MKEIILNLSKKQKIFISIVIIIIFALVLIYVYQKLYEEDSEIILSNNINDVTLNTNEIGTKEEKNDVYVAEYYARCLKPLGLYQENIETSFSYTQNDEENVNKLLKEYKLENQKLLGFCPACHSVKKSMQASDAAEFIDLVNKNGDYKIVVVGGSDVSDYAARLKELCKTEFTDLTGKTQYGETACIIDKCSKFVSVDTSCQHLALALKTPVVSIFFNKLFSKWGPADLNKNQIIVNLQDKKIDAGEILHKLEQIKEKKEGIICNIK